ncbi:MAG: TNT domain-containing protein [Sagittula sp.]|uniref:TNT domain-containing protein n=1 Tax=Sagittula sp. TaxID=2038081 RepID=UPI0040598B22
MGFWSGVQSGFVGAAKGTWEGVKGAGSYAWDFATDGATREAAWQGAVSASQSAGQYATDSWNDPSKPFRDLGNAASDAYAAADNFARTADAEQWGELAGGGAFTVATLPVGGLAAKGVARGGAALNAARGTKAVNAARRAGTLADDAPPCASCAARRAPPKRAPHLRSDLSDEWFDPDTGELRWPPNDGFEGTPTTETLQPGTRIDRFSGRTGEADTGSFLSPEGASFESRALPYEPSMQRHAVYEVVEPFEVQSGSAAPWFDQPGGATQYKTGASVGDLIRQGKIRQVQ